MAAETDVAWWSDTGNRLHKDPDCPPFVRARARAILAMKAGDFARGVRIRSFDFRASSTVDSIYPPERLLLCGLCGQAPLEATDADR